MVPTEGVLAGDGRPHVDSGGEENSENPAQSTSGLEARFVVPAAFEARGEINGSVHVDGGSLGGVDGGDEGRVRLLDC
jgi:hypothetical protein